MVTNTAPAVTTGPRPPRPPKRPVVLLLGHADGWCELYADQRIDAAFALLPAVEGPEAERLAEQFIETQLSRRHREIYLPGRCELVGQVRPDRPSDIARRQTLLEMHRAIGQLRRASA